MATDRLHVGASRAAHHPGEVVLAPRGALDLAAVDALERHVLGLRRAGVRRVVVDLGQLDLLDSAGLALLLSLRNEAKRHGHGLVLVPGPRRVQRTFELTATRGLFEWRAARGAACESPARPRALPPGHLVGSGP